VALFFENILPITQQVPGSGAGFDYGGSFRLCRRSHDLIDLWEEYIHKTSQKPLERNKMTVADKIETKLQEAFSPSHLTVIDESHLHAGHAGARPQGESHFKVDLISEKFIGMSRVERQRAVYSALSAELATDIHALSLSVKAPAE
jgi:BolA family transcriptional regulator, general stress-responsive regulator